MAPKGKGKQSAAATSSQPERHSSTDDQSLKASLSAQHFGFAPELFCTRLQENANMALYAAVSKLQLHIQQQREGATSKGKQKLQEEEKLEKQLYSLETLLESSVDDIFDRLDIWLVRNCFDAPEELVPFVVLPGQEALVSADPATTKDADLAQVEEYEREIKLYEEELERERLSKVVLESLERNIKRLEDNEDMIRGVGEGSGQFQAHTLRVLSLYPQLIAAAENLLGSAPIGPVSGSSAARGGGQEQARFVNETAKEKMALG